MSRKRPSEEPIHDEIQREEETTEEEEEEGKEEGEKKEEKDDVSRYYSLEAISSKHVKKYKATATDYRLRLRNLDAIALEALPLLSAVIDDVLQNMTLDISPNDMIRMFLDTPGLDKPIGLPFIKKDDLTMERFMARMEHVLQSKKDVKLDSSMQINLLHMEMPVGGKSKRPMFQTWEEKKKQWRCIIPITNQHDDMCLARAIVTGKARHELNCTDWFWRSIRDGGHHQTTQAVHLHKEAKVPFNACGLDQVKTFQEVIPNYQLCVVSKEHLNEIVWSGPYKSKGIYLLYNDHHFDLITSMNAYLNRGYWCHECKKAYDDRKSHRCEKTCKICHSGNCQVSDDIEAWTYCAECNRYFKSVQCYCNHKEEGSAIKKFGTVCNQYYKCKTCQRVVNKKFLRKGKEHD